MHASEAMAYVLRNPRRGRVLDIGCGNGEHSQAMRNAGFDVTSISLRKPADVVCDFADYKPSTMFSGIWASHVLEHQRNPGVFLDKCFSLLHPHAWLAITVPPSKPEIVGGHVSLWNAGLVLYHLILAGFDCRRAAVKTYGYNISVVVEKVPCAMPVLAMDDGDIERIAEFFPVPAHQGFDGNIARANWSSA